MIEEIHITGTKECRDFIHILIDIVIDKDIDRYTIEEKDAIRTDLEIEFTREIKILGENSHFCEVEY